MKEKLRGLGFSSVVGNSYIKEKLGDRRRVCESDFHFVVKLVLIA